MSKRNDSQRQGRHRAADRRRPATALPASRRAPLQSAAVSRKSDACRGIDIGRALSCRCRPTAYRAVPLRRARRDLVDHRREPLFVVGRLRHLGHNHQQAAFGDDGLRIVALPEPAAPRVARRQELESTEANAAQTCRTGIFHHQQITAAAAPRALPFAVQRPDHHQIRGTARFLCQAFAFLLGKRWRNPMGPVRRLDRRVPAQAEAQRLALRSARDIVRRAFGIFPSPRTGTASWLPICAAGWSARRARGNRSGPAATVPPSGRQATRSRRGRRWGLT
jgi:hypothetical protein